MERQILVDVRGQLVDGCFRGGNGLKGKIWSDFGDNALGDHSSKGS